MRIRITHCFSVISVCVVLMAVTPGAVFAQVSTGTISGTVYDSSSGVLPGATVTVTHQATNVERQTVSNTEGRFTLPFLPTGTYNVTVQLSGFKSGVLNGLQLSVGQSVDADIVLGVGDVSETVEVSAAGLRLQTTDTNVSQVIGEREVSNLPLSGRTFAQLAVLVPGANMGADANITMRRQRGSGGQAIGVSANGFSASQNKFTYDGVEAVDTDSYSFSFAPSIEAIQEFQVDTSTYSAAKGGAPGIHFNLVTKSGTNQLRGAAWEFHRNDALNARNAFGTGKEKLNRNQFGANVGGALVRNQLFGFFNWESSRVRRATVSRTVNVPPNEFRTGDFSALLAQGVRIMDPQTGQPFAGNIIPANRIRPASKTYLELLYPQATGTDNPAFNYRLPSLDVPIDERQFISRVDWAASNRDTLWVRHAYNNLYGDILLPAKYTSDDGVGEDAISQNLAIGWSRVVSASVVSQVLVARHKFSEDQWSPITERNIANGDMQLPGTSSDRSTWGHPYVSMGYEGTNDWPLFDRYNDMYSVSGSIDLSRGNHTLRAGGDVYRRVITEDSTLLGPGSYTFDGRQTADRATPVQAHQFADFLLGRASLVSLAPERVQVHHTSWNQSYFAQHTWRAQPSLTLNLGLRWDWFGRPVDRDDRMANFLLGNGNGRFVSEYFRAGTGPFGRKVAAEDYNNVGPRVGLAWQPANVPHFVLRGGWGIYYSPVIAAAYTLLVYNTPFSDTFTLVGTPTAPIQYDDPSLLTQPGVASIPSGFATDPQIRDTQAQQWNVTAQYLLAGNVMVDLAYVGSSASHLVTRYDEGNRPLELGVTTPIQPRRPLPTFSRIRTHNDIGVSNYHSLQAKVQGRPIPSVRLLTAYTFSKALGTVSGQPAGWGEGSGYQDVLNDDQAYGLLGFDVRHRFVSTALWELPRLESRNALTRAVLGGWNLNAILTLTSGIAMGVTTGLDTTGTGVPSLPDLVGDPVLPRSERSADRWFDTTAFAAPPQGRFGNSSANTFHGPGYANVDFSAIKAFSLGGTRQLDARIEIFNLFDRTNLGLPNRSLVSSSFGRITTARDPRIMQLGVKFAF